MRNHSDVQALANQFAMAVTARANEICTARGVTVELGDEPMTTTAIESLAMLLDVAPGSLLPALTR